ncbi:MAG: phosphoethanolamine transferase [Hyphomicrobiales bacterium]
MLAIFYFRDLLWYMNSPLRFAGLRNRVSAAALGVICALFLDYFHKPNFDIYSYIHAYRLMFKYSSWHQEVEQASKHRAKKFKLAEQGLNTHENHEKFDDIVIVVVGESVRHQNMQLYGYSRPTTPFLNQRKYELLIFEKAISPATSTVLSLKHVLTPLRPGDKKMLINQPSLVSEARLAGFKTSWITNTYFLGCHASPITIMARDAHELRPTSLETRNEKFRRYDGVVLPVVDELLTKQGKEKKFIFIGTMGSHAIFRYRYPPEFTKFKPVIENDANYHPDLAKEIVNAYDNSILYTDWLLNELITRLEKNGRPATLIYFSDHGKRLYDDGKTINHGFAAPTKVEVDVPLILWQSKNSRCKAEGLSGHTNQLFNLSDLYHLAKFATRIDMKAPAIEFDPNVFIHNKVMNYHQIPKG